MRRPGPSPAGIAGADGGLGALLDLAVRAAQAGGREIRARAGRVTGVGVKSTPTDPVTDTDRAAERAIVDVLIATRPDDGIVGEEGTARPGSTGLHWVIDPLDGTVNHLYGLPHTTVSVACEARESLADGSTAPWALVGAVHDPARGETFRAARGVGAWLGGELLRRRDVTDLGTALVATGFSYAATSRARQARVLAHLLPRVRDLRSHGSAALELCWVAAGRCDAYYEDELAPWDWAAGALIAAEAGAAVTPLGSGVLACPPGLATALADLLTTG